METYYVVEEWILSNGQVKHNYWSRCYKAWDIAHAKELCEGINGDTRIIKVTREVIEPEKTKDFPYEKVIY